MYTRRSDVGLLAVVVVVFKPVLLLLSLVVVVEVVAAVDLSPVLLPPLVVEVLKAHSGRADRMPGEPGRGC